MLRPVAVLYSTPEKWYKDRNGKRNGSSAEVHRRIRYHPFTVVLELVSFRPEIHGVPDSVMASAVRNKGLIAVGRTAYRRLRYGSRSPPLSARV